MRRLVQLFALLFLLMALAAFTRSAMLTPVHAEPLPEETRKLLEKTLSVVEIDREIGRIEKLQSATEADIKRSRTRLQEQEIAAAVQREQAGRTLRAVYMGRQQFWLTSLLSVRSIPELFRLWEAMDLVVGSDRRQMEQYAKTYRELKQGYAELGADSAELEDVRKQLVLQRERIATLQAEVDRALAASGDPELLRKRMEELQAYWQNVGLYEVKRHFRAIAGAMKKLPEWIKDHPEALKRKGMTATLTITDEQLNDFLRSQDKKFDSLAFSFDDGWLTLDGGSGDLSVIIQGRYRIENEPVNAIRFDVEKLVFNGLELPDTTRKELTREFDLGFYPQKLIKFLKAEDVKLDNGALIVTLKVGR